MQLKKQKKFKLLSKLIQSISSSKIKENEKKLKELTKLKTHNNIKNASLKMDVFDLDLVKAIAKNRYEKKNKKSFFDKYLLPSLNKKKYARLYGVRYGDDFKERYYRYLDFMNVVLEVAVFNRWFTVDTMKKKGIPVKKILNVFFSKTKNYVEVKRYYQKQEALIISEQHTGL